MILSGVVNLGNDAELKYLPQGTAIAEFSGAYNVGYGDRKETQWIKLALFGKQAEALANYLLKGSKVDIVASDVKVETWTGKDGKQGVTMKGKVINIDLISSGHNQNSGNGQPQGQQNNQNMNPQPYQQNYQNQNQNQNNGGGQNDQPLQRGQQTENGYQRY